MAIDFSPPAFSPYIGTPYGVPISLCTPLKSAPQTVPLTIDWSVYGASSSRDIAVSVNLLQLGSPGQVLDRIRSVYIDNSFSPTAIYVYFPDTQFMVIAAPNTIVMSPVFINDSQKVVIFAQDFVDNELPITTIHLSNVPQTGYSLSSGSGAHAALPTIVFAGRLAQAPVASVTQTFTGFATGTADPTRTIYCAVGFSTNSGGGITKATAAVINGIAMTLIGDFTFTNAGINADMALFAANVPLGTTGQVVVTYGRALPAAGAPNALNVDVFAAYHLISPLAPVNVNGGALVGAAGLSYNIGTSPDGVALASTLSTQPPSLGGIGNSNVSGVFGGAYFARGNQATFGSNIPIVLATGGAASQLASIGASFT